MTLGDAEGAGELSPGDTENQAAVLTGYNANHSPYLPYHKIKVLVMISTENFGQPVLPLRSGTITLWSPMLSA